MIFLRKTAIFSILMTGCIHVLTACSVFETREPELPGRGDGSAFIQPDQPRNVIENLVNSIASLNQVNYLRCLSDTEFEYNPTSQAMNSDPDLWSSWTRDDEVMYFNTMRAASENFQGHQLQLHNETTQDIDNTQIYTADYILTINHNRDSGQSRVPTVATGSLRLTLRSGEDGLWAIVSWSDSPQDNQWSWSNMRAAFR